MSRNSPRSVIIVLASLAVFAAATWTLHEAWLVARVTGLVEVAPRSRGVVREAVPWPRAWGYLSGLAMFVVAATLGLVHPWIRPQVARIGLAALALGAYLVILSGLLVHPLSAVALIGIVLGAPIALYFTLKSGRTSVLVVWLVVLIAFFDAAWHA